MNWTILSLCLGNRLFYSPSWIWMLLTLFLGIRLLRLKQNGILISCMLFSLLTIIVSSNIERFKESSYQEWLKQRSTLRIRLDQLVINGDRLKITIHPWFGEVQLYANLATPKQKEQLNKLRGTALLEVATKPQKPSEKHNLGEMDWESFQKSAQIRGKLEIISLRIKQFEASSYFSLKEWRAFLLQKINEYFPPAYSTLFAQLYLRYQTAEFPELRENLRKMGLGLLLSATWLAWLSLIEGLKNFLLRSGFLLEEIVYFECLLMGLAIVLTAGSPLLVIRCSEKLLRLSKGLSKEQAFWLAWGTYCFLWAPASLGNVLLYLPIGIQLLRWLDFEQLGTQKQWLFFQGLLLILTLHWEQRLSLVSFLVALLAYWCFRNNGWRLVQFIFLVQLLVGNRKLFQLLEKSEQLGAALRNQKSLVFFLETCTLAVKKLAPEVVWLLLFLWISILFGGKALLKRHKFCFFGCLLYVAQGFILWQGMVAVIDVGQGDAILVQLPFNRQVWLIDTGGKVDFAQASWRRSKRQSRTQISELDGLLRARGIKTIDEVLITHGHQDHCGNLAALARYFRVKRIRAPIGAFKQAALQRQLKQMEKGGTRPQIVPIKRLFSLKLARSYTLTALSPAKEGDGGNDDSLVLKLELRGMRLLMMGDLEIAGEQALLASEQNLRADALKVGHHGSRSSTSAAFLKAVQPEVGLISCGQNNRYQHPHKETIQQLKKAKIQVFRTDQSGMIWTSWWPWQKASPRFQTIRH